MNPPSYAFTVGMFVGAGISIVGFLLGHFVL